MKRKQRTWRTAALCLLLCLGLMRTAAQASYPYPAITDRETPCSLTLDMGAPGVTVRVYRAAEVTEDVRFVLTGDFAGYNVDLDGLTSTGWASLAQTLRGYVFLDAIQPLRTGVSDETGRLTFSDLPVGLYLVDGERIASTEDDGYRQPAPFMICLPNWEQSTDPETGTVSGGWQYNVAARPKYTTLDGDVVMRRVLKVWNDGGSISRPAQISVTLLKDGEPYETVDLNAENNWRYAWDELDGSSDWQIVESSGSGGYTVSVQLEGGSGKAKVESPAALRVEGGCAYATIVWGSSSYDYMRIEEEKFLPLSTEGNSSFEIPVTSFDRKLVVYADTTAMSTPHEIEYTLCFDSASIKSAS